MRILPFLIAFFFIFKMHAQSLTSNFFDTESVLNHHSKAQNDLRDEHLQGRVKEVKRLSDDVVFLHLKLDKKGGIVEAREYAGTTDLTRMITFRNGKTVKAVNYKGSTPSYVLYDYDKDGRLSTLTTSGNQNGKNPSINVKYIYDNGGNIISQENSETGTTRFLYEGDSVIWKLVFKQDSMLQEVEQYRKDEGKGSELTTWYSLDRHSERDFKNRIKPVRAVMVQRNAQGKPVEQAEFLYDSLGNKIVQSIIRQEYADGRLRMKSAIHNTDMLKGKFVTTYVYNDQGLLEAQLFREENNPEKRILYQYDDHGNVISDGGFSYQYVYDTHDNWIVKRVLKNGSWITAERREIVYYK